MTYETLQYVDAGGATQEVAFQRLSSKGVEVAEFFPRSHAAGEFHITLPQPPEIPLAIPFKSRCIVRACRTSATGNDNSFSDGTILFQGRRTDNSGSSSSANVRTNLVLSDVLWDLKKITYQILWQKITGGTLTSPTYSTFYFPDVILFQASPAITYSPASVNSSITTWQQIQDIVRYATSYASGADAAQVQLAGSGTLTGSVWSAGTGAEFTPTYCHWYPVRSMKCLDALTICLRPHPAVYTEIDHSTTPPTLHFRSRTNLTAVNLPYKSTDANGITHVATNIQPLHDLVPDRVAIFAKVNGTFNGQPVITDSNDIYPVAAGPSLLSEDFSLDVTGASREETIYNFTSEAFDPTDKDLWRLKVPALKQIADGGQVANDGDDGALTFADTTINSGGGHPKCITVEDDDGNAIDLSTYLYITDDDVFTWMKLSSGTAVSVKKATVKAFFSYKKTTAISATTVKDRFAEHHHQFRVTLTNAPSDQYIFKQTLNTGETMPPNMAQNIYTELQALQWKLRHEVWQIGADASTVPTLIKPGKHKINLVGGDADWTTMNAVPENISIKFLRTGDGRLCAIHNISCGPVNHLEPSYRVQLYSLFSNRDLARIDASQRLSGRTSSSQVDLSGARSLENSTAAESVPSEKCVVSGDGTIREMLDAENGAFALLGTGAQGKVVLSIKAAAKYNNPAGGGAVAGGTNVTLPDGTTILVGGCLDKDGNPHTLEVWQMVTCEDDGSGTSTTAEYCRLIVMSERFAKPAGW